MLIRQIKLSRMETFCYLVADEATKTCVLIDPAFDTENVLGAARAAGFTVTTIVNTHGHPDHTAGNAAVVAATNARLMIHEKDARHLDRWLTRGFSRVLGGKGSPRPDRLLRHGDRIAIGTTALEVLHTPGHTPGSISLYTPGHVFTGDALFVGSVGRTDLPGGSSETLLHSIRHILYALPGDTIVWPGHDYGHRPSSTVEREKYTNAFTLTG